MSLVDIRVDLPTHSHSFTVSVPSQYSVLQVKQEIYGICPGQPRPEVRGLSGAVAYCQTTRLWNRCGRLVLILCELEAVSHECSVDGPKDSSPCCSSISLVVEAARGLPGYQSVQHNPSRVAHAPCSPSTSSASTRTLSTLHPVLAYVAHQHQKALSSLSSSIPIPNELETPEFHR
jgi:hypothetical protein